MDLRFSFNSASVVANQIDLFARLGSVDLRVNLALGENRGGHVRHSSMSVGGKVLTMFFLMRRTP